MKWTFAAFGQVSATPTVRGDDVFFTDWGGGVHRVSLQTGKVGVLVSCACTIFYEDVGYIIVCRRVKNGHANTHES